VRQLAVSKGDNAKRSQCDDAELSEDVTRRTFSSIENQGEGPRRRWTVRQRLKPRAEVKSDPENCPGQEANFNVSVRTGHGIYRLRTSLGAKSVGMADVTRAVSREVWSLHWCSLSGTTVLDHPDASGFSGSG